MLAGVARVADGESEGVVAIPLQDVEEKVRGLGTHPATWCHNHLVVGERLNKVDEAVEEGDESSVGGVFRGEGDRLDHLCSRLKNQRL